MTKTILLLLLSLLLNNLLLGQDAQTDSTIIYELKEIVVTANRLPVLWKSNPGALSLVTPDQLLTMPKSIAAEEALRLVPGVRIDNQHDAERVHVSIRGQGILTERGLRGIGVILDGIPVNDPSGFAPDLYDVDWATVRNIEVLRGPVAGLYGGSSAAGLINIYTMDGGTKPIGGVVSQTIGSHNFRKSLLHLDGLMNVVNYRLSYSRTDGDGYRDHQAFWSNKLYEKIGFHPSQSLSFKQIYSHTDYFQQNPEGLNLEQFDNLRQANPDARPFNEYQKTNRNTIGLTGIYKPNQMQEIEAVVYLHSWNYKETSNKSAEYRDINNPGVSAQYNLQIKSGNFNNTISIGTDVKWQNINMYKLQSAANPDRTESTDQTNIETDSLLANQIISQQSTGLFALYKMEIGKFMLMGNIRYDEMENQLTDKMLASDLSKTSKNFTQTSLRVGTSYVFSDLFNLYANWSQGFMPPSTEELAGNPVGYSGFNTHLVPATSNCFEIGNRGFISDKLNFELTGFIMKTEHDFFRFKQSGRGNQEVFYGNAGNSDRYGIEAFASFKIFKNLTWQTAYTFSDFKYTSATIDPVYTDTAYVLTTPPKEGQWLPNSPKHQLYSEINYRFNKNLKLSLGTEYQSKWAIYTDANAYAGELDPDIYRNWQDGFNLYNTQIVYNRKINNVDYELNLVIRNLTSEKYIAFTEPDPDGNSYQPGPVREFFGGIKIRF